MKSTQTKKPSPPARQLARRLERIEIALQGIHASLEKIATALCPQQAYADERCSVDDFHANQTLKPLPRADQNSAA